MAIAATDPNQILIERVASYALDPLGFVFFAFPWGEAGTELADAAGPRDWQFELMAELGRRLREGSEIANLLPILIAREWARRRQVDCGGMGNSVGSLDNAQPPHCRDREHQLATADKNLAGGHQMASADDEPRLVQGNRNSYVVRPTRARAAMACRRHPVERGKLFAGLHNKGRRVILILDEASPISDKIWEVSEGACQHDPDRRGALAHLRH